MGIRTKVISKQTPFEKAKKELTTTTITKTKKRTKLVKDGESKKTENTTHENNKILVPVVANGVSKKKKTNNTESKKKRQNNKLIVTPNSNAVTTIDKNKEEPVENKIKADELKLIASTPKVKESKTSDDELTRLIDKVAKLKKKRIRKPRPKKTTVIPDTEDSGGSKGAEDGLQQRFKRKKSIEEHDRGQSSGSDSKTLKKRALNDEVTQNKSQKPQISKTLKRLKKNRFKLIEHGRPRAKASRCSTRIFLQSKTKLHSSFSEALQNHYYHNPLRTVEIIKRPLELRDPATKILFLANLGLYPKSDGPESSPIVVLMESSEVSNPDEYVNHCYCPPYDDDLSSEVQPAKKKPPTRVTRKKAVPKNKRIRRVESLKRSHLLSPTSSSSSSPMPQTPLSSPHNTDTGSVDEMDMQPMDLSMKASVFSSNDKSPMSSLALLASVADRTMPNENGTKGRRILSPANSVSQPPMDLSSKKTKKQSRSTKAKAIKNNTTRLVIENLKNGDSAVSTSCSTADVEKDPNLLISIPSGSKISPPVRINAN